MNLKQISTSVLATILGVFSFSSCNDDTTTVDQTYSSDAQIYSIAFKAIPRTAIDTINFPILEATVFAIDQQARVIYNPDSLPYGTVLKKYATTMTYNPKYGVNSVTINYKDSAVVWNASDSIDYSIVKGFTIKAPNGTSRDYTLLFRIHQIDPDTIVWKQHASSPNNITTQKTILKANMFYSYSLTGSTLVLNTFNKTSGAWSRQSLTDAPTSVKLESITLYNNTFFAVNTAGNTFSSVDGLAWNSLGGSDIYNLLGILPGKNTSDDNALLAIKKSGNNYQYAKTEDMVTFDILPIRGGSANIAANFPSTGFSSTSNLQQGSPLIVTGGKAFNNSLTNLTWSLKMGNDNIEVIRTNQYEENISFGKKEGIETFLYDNKLYALTDSTFYRSTSTGAVWSKAPQKQNLHASMPRTLGQSVIVDEANYIWIFGGVSGKPVEVWSGRLNRLIPKP